MSMISSLIERLRETANDIFENIDSELPVCKADAGLMREAADTLEMLSEKARTGWIPVSERLPEDMQRVLIWFEYYRYGNFNCMYQTYGFGYVCDGEWSSFINGETGWRDAKIIAWMPLPEPYKEDKDEISN